ncbi:MAG: glycosyltransferase family 4 protein [Chloroflexota bacterium]|nr:glycosyltransferase family 4 protein [Chloroflexota bacterium]
MKIAMVSPYDFTWPGGVTAHVSQLAQELTQCGHQVTVIAPHSPSRQCFEAESFVPLGRSVPVPSGGSIARVSLSWWLYPKVREMLQEESFDLIHLHEPLAPILPLCFLECSNTVNVGTFHAYYSRQHLYRFSQPIIRRWHNRLHGGIAVSPAARRYVHNFFPRDYRIIPNGIDVDHFAGNAKPWPQYQDGKTNILFVGRKEKRKGLKYLLEAYCRLKWERPETRLIIVGPGDLDRDSQGIVSARNPGDVEIVGGVSYRDLPRYYATADIFCSPATGQESFGIVLLEAMACGKPIVASAIEGYMGIVKEGEQGLLFPRKDAQALAETLATLIDNPDYARRLGQTGRRMVEQYRWQAVARQVESYYLDCISENDGHSG